MVDEGMLGGSPTRYHRMFDETPFHSLGLAFDARECARIWFEPVGLEALVKRNGTVLSDFIPFSAPDDLMGGS